MGAFDDIQNITIPDPSDQNAASVFRKKWGWEEHEQVLIKGSITVADEEYVTDQYSSMNKQTEIQIKMGRGRFAILERMIIAWTLMRNGSPVPLTQQNIKKLPHNYSTPILEVIDKIGVAMTEEEQENFFNSAEEHTLANSKSMN